MKWLTIAMGVASILASCSSTSVPPTSLADASTDAPSEGAACSCDDAFNVTQTSANATIGPAWFAWKYQPSCAFVATTIDVSTTSLVFAVFADDAGKPGAALVPTVNAQPLSGKVGWMRASVSVSESPGKSYWIAVQNGGGIDSTISPIAQSGVPTAYGGGSPGNWTVGNTGPMIFEVSGCH